MSTVHRAAIVAACLSLVLTQVPVVVAASQVTDCGAYTEYTAPDPLGPTDGSLRLAQFPIRAIAADATIDPAVESAIPGLISGQVTCLRMDLDDAGVIVGLAFASSGTIQGDVVFDPGLDAYLVADRLMVPKFVVDLFPGFDGLFATSAAAGTPVSLRLGVDDTTGAQTSFSGEGAFCGIGGIDDDGNGSVGAATILADLLDGDDVERLMGAGSMSICATVHIAGVVDPGSGALDLTSDVEIVVATPTAPPTSTLNAAASSSPGTNGVGWAVLSLLMMIVLGFATASRSSRDRVALKGPSAASVEP